jgi:hypothetical protein
MSASRGGRRWWSHTRGRGSLWTISHCGVDISMQGGSYAVCVPMRGGAMAEERVRCAARKKGRDGSTVGRAGRRTGRRRDNMVRRSQSGVCKRRGAAVQQPWQWPRVRLPLEFNAPAVAAAAVHPTVPRHCSLSPPRNISGHLKRARIARILSPNLLPRNISMSRVGITTRDCPRGGLWAVASGEGRSCVCQPARICCCLQRAGTAAVPASVRAAQSAK